MDRVGYLEVLDGTDEPVGAALALELAGLDQRLDHLLGEEGVPRGARLDRLGQLGDARVRSE